MTPFTSAHKALIGLVIACVSAGCATLKVSVYAAGGVDITHYRTFDWGRPTLSPRVILGSITIDSLTSAFGHK